MMFRKCAICGKEEYVEKERSLCINCGDAIQRLVWIAQENPEMYPPAPPEPADNSAVEDAAAPPQAANAGLLARLGWAGMFD